jgi:hypothetical protein
MTKQVGARRVHTIDASVSKKRTTKQHLKYNHLCHEQRDKQHANKNGSEEAREGRKGMAAHEREADVRNEARDEQCVKHSTTPSTHTNATSMHKEKEQRLEIEQDENIDEMTLQHCSRCRIRVEWKKRFRIVGTNDWA